MVMQKRLRILPGEPVAQLLPELIPPAGAWWHAVTAVVGGKPDLAIERVIAALDKLVALGDERAIPSLTALLAASQPKIRRAAGRAVERLMPRDMAGLMLYEASNRDQGPYGYEAWWPDNRPAVDRYLPEPVARVAIDNGLPIQALGLLSFNANGRTRELATRALAAAKGDEAVGFLLLRANDWVTQVSEVARGALEQRCVANEAGVFAATFPLVERLATQRRVDNAALLTRVEALLVDTEEGRAALATMLLSAADRDVRRALARLVRRRKVLLGPLEPAFADPDAVVRTQAILAGLERGALADLQRWVPRFLRDSSPRIRALAFHAAAAKLPELLQATLAGFLFDDNFWMREFARQRIGGERGAFAQIYVAAIGNDEPAKLRAALAGLGEVGTADDAAAVLPHTSVGSSGTRQVALRALFSLQKEKAVPVLVSALASDRAGVSKVAAELLSTRGLIVFGDDLAPLTQAAQPHVRAYALRTIAGIDRWDALICALERATDPDARVLVVAKRILARWQYVPHELYTSPKGAQRERLVAALAAAPAGLSNVLRTVEFILG